MKHPRTAMALLLSGLGAAYLWKLDVWAMPAHVWNATGAAYRLVLLGLVACAYPSWSVRSVCALLAVFDALVVGCSSAYMLNPWPIVPGQSCTARLDIPLAVLGAVAALALVLAILRRPRD